MGKLIVIKEELAKMVETKDDFSVSNIFKKRIFLKDLYVSFTDRKHYRNDLSINDEITLKHEKLIYDSHNVNVLDKNNGFIGVLGEFDNEIIANLLDAGKEIVAKVKHFITSREFPVLLISVYMIDY